MLADVARLSCSTTKSRYSALTMDGLEQGWRFPSNTVMFTPMSDERQPGDAGTGRSPAGQPQGEDPAASGDRTRPPPARGGRRGRGTRPVDRDRPCLNCGDPTPGEFCPTCGQRKAEIQVSVRTLLMDVLEDQVILDKRLPRSLKALFFKPGQLTVEHVNGRIVRYIHPFRLYIVTSLVFFLLLSFFSLRLVREGDSGPGAALPADSIRQELASIDSALARIGRQLADTAASPLLRTTLEATQTQLVEERGGLQARLDAAPGDSIPDTLSVSAAGPAPPDTAAASTVRTTFQLGDNLEVHTGFAPLDSALVHQIRRLADMEPREAAETVLGTFFNYVPTMMFVLLPLFAAVLKLLYIRRRRYYAEHFVFLLHVHSFVFILATIMLVFSRWLGRWLDALLVGWILVYIYLAMKRVYGQGWLKTFWKYWTLGWMYFWIMILALPVALVVTLLLA